MAVYICLAFIVIILTACVVCNLLVINASSGKSYDKVADIPHNKYGLVLGTSPINSAGNTNLYFFHRIEAANALFKAGKVYTLIVSGGDDSDESSNGYDEPQAMRDELIKRGVPSERILMDYHGERTIKSILNARDIYHLDSVTLISQSYHNSRTLYLAKHYGLNAIAFNAKEPDVKKKVVKNHVREYLARVKMFIDLLRQKE